MATKEEPHLRPPEELRLDNRIVVLTIVLSIVLFVIINEVLRHLSQRYSSFSLLSKWRCRNLAVSWLHADMATALCLYWYLFHSHEVRTWMDFLDLEQVAAYSIISFITGYFVYDCWDHIQQGKAIAMWEVMAHHVAVLVIVGYSLLFNIAIVSNVLALMMEVNSALLHGRKLLQMFGMPFSHWFYRIVVVLNLISFLFFRGVPLSLLWIGFYHNFDRCTTAHAFALGIVLVFMAFLNPVLFWRLLKNDLLRGSPKKKRGR